MAYVGMAYVVLAYIVMAYTVLVCIVLAYVVMVYIFMVYIIVAYIVMARVYKCAMDIWFGICWTLSEHPYRDQSTGRDRPTGGACSLSFFLDAACRLGAQDSPNGARQGPLTTRRSSIQT